MVYRGRVPRWCCQDRLLIVSAAGGGGDDVTQTRDPVAARRHAQGRRVERAAANSHAGLRDGARGRVDSFRSRVCERGRGVTLESALTSDLSSGPQSQH